MGRERLPGAEARTQLWGQSGLALHDFTWEPRDLDRVARRKPERVLRAEHHYARFTHGKTEK